LREFIDQLVQHHRSLASESDDELGASATSLTIAQALLTKLQVIRQASASASSGKFPAQLVVIGPTQAGKSSAVNWLLGRELAESNAQAGFTVHCQGFHVLTNNLSDNNNDNGWADQFFSGLQRADLTSLDRQVLTEYSLQQVNAPESVFADTVVWDTPDFDSMRSNHYRTPLLRAIAIADLVVLVVSKEKYADRTVWSLLDLLVDMRVPVVLLMNKTDESVRAELEASMQQKFTAAFKDTAMPPLHFVSDYRAEVDSAGASIDVSELRDAVRQHLKVPDEKHLQEDAVHFLKAHWQEWTAGLQSNYRVQRDYEVMVNRLSDDLVQRYQKEYIDSDRHKEVLQLALSELLVLLEIPIMAKSLGKVRSAVTWPVRKLLGTRNRSIAQDDRNEERRILDELCKHAVANLGTGISIRNTGKDASQWSELLLCVEQEGANINAGYLQSLDEYQAGLQRKIDEAAQSLYTTLEKQPATLASLRAARVTTDAAAVVLAVKSGGLGAVDLVLAPAMLSLTTLLTEGALGQYMQRVQKELTSYQQRQVKTVIDEYIREPLSELPKTCAGRSSVAGQPVIEIPETSMLAAVKKLERGDV